MPYPRQMCAWSLTALVSACGSPGNDHEGAPVELPLGSCAVVADFELPVERLYARPTNEHWSPVVRLPGGFMASGSSGDGAAVKSFLIFTSEDGEVQTPWETAEIGYPLDASPDAARVVTVRGEDVEGYTSRLIAQPFALDTEPGEAHELGTYFSRGSRTFGQASSFDGQRALWVSSHVEYDPLHGFLVRPDGARVGDALVLHESAESMTECLEVTPTLHGAAVSGYEGEGAERLWKLREIGPEGRVVQTFTLPGNTAACPSVWPGREAEFLVRFTDGKLYELAQQEARVVLALEALGGSLHWVSLSHIGSLLLLTEKTTGGLVITEVLSDGTLRELTGEIPAGSEPVPSEAGRLFLSVEREGSRPRLVEVACNTGLAP